MTTDPRAEGAGCDCAAFERLIYCINGRYDRLFRWRDGHIEWRPKWRPWRWQVIV